MLNGCSLTSAYANEINRTNYVDSIFYIIKCITKMMNLDAAICTV